MSNEEPEDRTSTDPVKEWGASDFYGIAIDPKLLERGVGEDELSASAARQDIFERLEAALVASGANVANRRDEARDLAKLIVASLPDNAMSAGVIAAIDLRPYAARYVQFDARGPDDERFLSEDGTADMVGRQALVDGLNAQAERAVENAVKSYGLSLAQVEVAKKEITTFDPTKAGISFEVQALERGSTFSQAAAGGALPAGADATNPMSPTWDPSTLVERQTQQVGIPEEELRQLAASGMTDLAGLFSQELQLQSERNTKDYLPVEIAQQGGVDIAGGTRGQMKKLSIINAMTYLQTLPDSQVADMQKKMAAAGYYNELSTPRGYIEGDAFDDATMEAWNNLVMESISRNVPVTKLMGARLQGYQERNRAKLEQQLLPIDQQYLDQAGDMAMQELVGRQLTVAESKQLVSYLDTLRSQRAGYVQGAGDINQGIDGPLRGDYGFDDNDINARIQQLAAPEMAGQRGFDTAQKVWQAFDLGEIDTQALAQWRRDNRPATLGKEEEY